MRAVVRGDEVVWAVRAPACGRMEADVEALSDVWDGSLVGHPRRSQLSEPASHVPIGRCAAHVSFSTVSKWVESHFIRGGRIETMWQGESAPEQSDVATRLDRGDRGCERDGRCLR